MIDRRVYYYKIFCNTDNKYVYVWSKIQPSTCPENTTHSINLSSVVVIDDIRSNTVEIMEEAPNDDPTGGRYKCQGLSIPDIVLSKKYSQCFSWIYPVSILSMKFNTEEINRGDKVDCEIIPTIFLGNTRNELPVNASEIQMISVSKVSVGMDIYITDGEITWNCGMVLAKNIEANTITIEFPSIYNIRKNAYVSYSAGIGSTTATAVPGETVLTVNSITTTQATKGYQIEINGNGIKQNLGEIFDIDKVANKITVQNPISSQMEIGSVIRVQSKVVENYCLGVPGSHCIGDGKIGGSYNKKLYVMRTTYTNKSNATSKNFNYWVEILY
jgi:hypothetical protein